MSFYDSEARKQHRKILPCVTQVFQWFPCRPHVLSSAPCESQLSIHNVMIRLSPKSLGIHAHRLFHHDVL